MKRKNKKNKSLDTFIKYIFSIFLLSAFLITFLTIKNQCAKLRNEISEIKISNIKNRSIVKRLQSEKEKFSSEKFIFSKVKDNMIAKVPEPEIIDIRNE